MFHAAAQTHCCFIEHSHVLCKVELRIIDLNRFRRWTESNFRRVWFVWLPAKPVPAVHDCC